MVAANVTRLPSTKPRLRVVDPVTSQAKKLAVLHKQKPGDLAEAYITIRDQKRKLEEEAKALGAKLETLEQVLLEKLQKDLKIDGYHACGHKVYRYTKVTARVTDPLELRNFVLADPEKRLDVMETRASLDGVRNWMDLHPVVDKKSGAVITPTPPGTELHRFDKLGVAKS